MIATDFFKQCGKALYGVINALGQEDFEPQLAVFAGEFVPHSKISIARYTKGGQPDFLLYTQNFPAHHAQSYLTLYHFFDPFIEYWDDVQKPGVVWLGDLKASRRKIERYVVEFLRSLDIVDEIGIFLPPIGRSSLGIFLESATHRFSHSQRQKLQRVYPLIASLYQAHIRILLNQPDKFDSSPSLNKLLMITKSDGYVIWKSHKWNDANKDIEEHSFSSLPVEPFSLTENKILYPHMEQFVSSPTLAPALAPTSDENRVFWLEATLKSAPSDFKTTEFRVGSWDFDKTLTARECDIIELILKGHSTNSIAAILKVSRGTIKNHRARIYQKLDIENERTLILRYINALIIPEPG